MADEKVSKKIKKIKKMRERIRLAASGDEATAIIKKALFGPPPEMMLVNPNAGIAM